MKCRFSLGALALVLPFTQMIGCASSADPSLRTQEHINAPLARETTWQAPLAHSGSNAQLLNWWSQLGDPALDELMQSAQRSNATLSAALAGIAQARAAASLANQEDGPNLALVAQASRAVQQPKAQGATALGLGLQASWEMDLWDSGAAAPDAARWRARAAELGWHEARVALAAEVAANYLAYRHCEAMLALAQRDSASRQETARLTQQSAQAGFVASASAQLARASSHDAASTLAATRAQCDIWVKALVALSGQAEAPLREKLKASQDAAQKMFMQGDLFSMAAAVPSLPAQLLSQRPDIAAAQAAVAAAALDIQSADAKRYPALSLTGSIGTSQVRQMGLAQSGLTWSFGPLTLTLPITQQGFLRENAQAAIAAYDAALTRLQSKARQAVREVEEALVNLHATQLRSEQSKAAAADYAAALVATQARQRAGLASLIELEEMRRTTLLAQQNQLSVERERILAWISLYRASGGGWTAQDAAPSIASSAH